ncbi:MAG: bioF [Gammaproteobacteria bacterium]|jgi:8-amino-7-oxononanoate synthase|nr:bioF [Gammaproteobacteria bacterium]
MLTEKIQNRLIQHANQSLIRKRCIVETEKTNRISVENNSCIDFSSNDYLGLKKHPSIIEAFIKSAEKYGVGSGASATVSGYSKEHAETEQLFSEWLGVDKTILFNSGYCANVGIISSLVSRSNTIFSDKLCHASLLDGIILSRAQHYRYQNVNMERLYHMAESHSPDLIVTESIFSMEGRLAPIDSLVQLAKHYKSGLLIDDAHGIGILGKTGAGIIEHHEINQQDFSCLVLPLGKAFNAMGAIIAGKSEIMEGILQFCRTYRYTTAIAPAICSAIQASLKIIKEENWRRYELIKNIRFFISYANDQGLSLLSYDDTPIKPILIHDNTRTLALQNFLLAKGLHVPAIRPPTVPENKARLRVSLNSLHTQDEIMLLVDNIVAGLRLC